MRALRKLRRRGAHRADGRRLTVEQTIIAAAGPFVDPFTGPLFPPFYDERYVR